MNLFIYRLTHESLMWHPFVAESFADLPKHADAMLVEEAKDAEGNVYPVIVGEPKKRGKK